MVRAPLDSRSLSIIVDTIMLTVDLVVLVSLAILLVPPVLLAMLLRVISGEELPDYPAINRPCRNSSVALRPLTGAGG